jgi:hypothetical protein
MALFRKKQHWFRSAFKSIVFALVIFKIAMGFRKKSEKMSARKI